MPCHTSHSFCTKRRSAAELRAPFAGSSLYTAHAGDTRAVLCRQGKALRLTQDHKPNLPQERARIEGVGGRINFQSNCWWGSPAEAARRGARCCCPLSHALCQGVAH
jgi:hypothetical protein